MADTRTCSRCKETKSLSEFGRGSHGKDGLKYWCKKCTIEYNQAYRTANREKVRAADRARYAANSEKLIARQLAYYRANRVQTVSRNLQRNYGISLADYDEMLEAQDGGCAICGKSPEANGRRLGVDHNHATGEVRGLLCSACNTGLGLFQDSPACLRRAISYLEFAADS